MKGVKFPEQTTVYGKPEGWKDEDCYGLPVAQSFYLNSDQKPVPCLISSWEGELTDEQIDEIIRSRKVKVFLSITGTGMPPVSLQVDTPFGEHYDPQAGIAFHRQLREGVL
jgi:hypothetical protein